MRALAALLIAACIAVAVMAAGNAAEATTGIVSGTVVDAHGVTVAGARVAAASPSGRYAAVSDERGRFTLLGVTPDSYTVTVEAVGFEPLVESGVLVLPGQNAVLAVRLAGTLRTVGTVQAKSSAFTHGATSDSFTVNGDAARALAPPATSSGLGNYGAGTVQGSIASVPGVDFDAFGNAILRGGKIDDAVFTFDSVPVPQGLVAEPGGNVVGAQLPTTGIGSTTVTLAGYETQGDNALGGVIDQIPAVGTNPGSVRISLADGLAGGLFQTSDLEILGASPDLKWRYALAAYAGSEYFGYGDGRTFYPSEVGTYGLALQSRGQFSITGNVHDRLSPSDDLSFVALAGQATYDQYGSPYAGETVGAFNGQTTVYPGSTNPNAPVDYASGVRGTYDILKLQWLHSGAHSLSRVQLYQTQFGSQAGGPFWDENGFPDGSISLASQQGGREEGLGYDGEDVLGERHHLRFGAEYRIDNSFLNEIVPTADEVIASNPTLYSALAYVGDTWSVSRRLDVTGAARLTNTHIVPSDGFSYNVGAIDPHVASSYELGSNYTLRATFDHNTVAPKPLEADRTDSTNVTPTGSPAPFVPLAPEKGDDFTYSFEGGSRTQFRATYFAEYENNRIDVLPYNFRSAVAGGLNPDGVGVPTNIGKLQAHGFELWLKRDGFTLDSNLIRGSSSSASQFAYNDLNAPAVAANHLFPLGYVPDFTTTLSYEVPLAGGRVRLTPAVSYATGYPYGNGKMVYIFNPQTNKPQLVPNDNYVNPGENYYFLQNPSNPYNPVSNPYIGNLGTPEGNDPNTLRSPPLLLVNVHLESALSRRVSASFDVNNLFGNATPSAYQVNPYLIGPPGYAGGNPLYAIAYQAAGGYNAPYTLGNGVPTNDGVHQAVPWSYGRAGYVPQGYPNARTLRLKFQYRM
jgi:hypothetical protein